MGLEKKGEVLQGWKEIATYVSRDVRTARRWETLRGLPVRRNPGGGRANVYALPSELDLWLGRVSLDLDAEVVPSGAAVEFATPDLPVEVHGPSRAMPYRMAVALVLLVAIVLTFAVSMHRGSPTMRTSVKAATNSSGMPYPSKVPEVTELYLRGVYLNDRLTPQGFRLALPVLLQATAKDPGYAPAWAALANTYVSLNQFSVLEPQQAFPAAREAALRALALDPKLSRAHTALAVVDALSAFDFAASNREFHVAIGLDPADSVAHHWFGAILMLEGFYSQSLEELNFAQKLQPGVTNVLISRATALGLSGHRDEAVAQIEEIDRIDSGTIAAPWRMANLCLLAPHDIPCYLRNARRFSEMIHDLNQASRLGKADPVFRKSGEAAMWAYLLEQEKNHTSHKHIELVDLEAISGHKEEALRDLGRLVQSHDQGLVSLKVDTHLESIWSDPRFRQMAAAFGLPAAP